MPDRVSARSKEQVNCLSEGRTGHCTVAAPDPARDIGSGRDTWLELTVQEDK